MAGSNSRLRARVTVNGEDYHLVRSQDLSALKARFEQALASPGRFVDFAVAGDREVSVLITPVSQVIFTTRVLDLDAANTGDPDPPGLGEYDEFG